MFNKTVSLLLIVFCAIPFCSIAQKTTDKKAKAIIQQCVAVHGGKNYQNVNVSFDFRRYAFKIKSNGSMFEYERTTKDSLNNMVRDVLNNAGFARDINGQKQTLTAKEEDKYREGVNSVAYFVLLPYKLLDASVNLSHIGTIKIDNQAYDKIKVWFAFNIVLLVVAVFTRNVFRFNLNIRS